MKREANLWISLGSNIVGDIWDDVTTQQQHIKQRSDRFYTF